MSRNEQQINARITELNEEAVRLVEAANSRVTEVVPNSLVIRYEISAPRDVFTPFERAQSLCFVAKYGALPESYQVQVKLHNGRYYPDNIDDFRHLLNEYRSVIQNVGDSTHHSKVHHLCRQKLRNPDPRLDLKFSVMDDAGSDLTKSFTLFLDQKHSAIVWLIKQLEFDYLYNGILQHADHAFTDRYIAEYASGELHYVFFKHAMVCVHIKQEMWWHFRLLSALSGVNMGPL